MKLGTVVVGVGAASFMAYAHFSGKNKINANGGAGDIYGPALPAPPNSGVIKLPILPIPIVGGKYGPTWMDNPTGATVKTNDPNVGTVNVDRVGNPDYAAIAAAYGKEIMYDNMTTDLYQINVDGWGNVTLQDLNSQNAVFNGKIYTSNAAVLAAELAWAIAQGIRDSDGNLIPGTQFPGVNNNYEV